MSSLLVKAQAGSTIVEVTPESAGWTHVGFAAHRLASGEQISLETAGRELCIVVLTGTVTVKVGEQSWENIGERLSVFEDRAPAAVYVPRRMRVSITATSDAEVGLCSAPGTSDRPVRLIDPNTMTRSVRGKGANTRYVRDILPQTEAADGLLVVEVVTPSGHSSSYPPHKHDSDNIPTESSLEETYYHRLNPAQGFAYQRVYTDDRSIDQALAVENHDVVMVPRGYHPVTMPYGYDGYYLNVMAGPKRVWHFKNDPAHEWLMNK
ncbi:5-deoxy-glucuronate isomerase [Janthinobacterium sp. PC23-8]|uniref:5-deoxy-glucuronate isomerase n=1 Tax=Janthinobacterium sp. PC23-8 TaxID=2012679 RepID=UPI000B976286|nr:5-deoxy-glucuronate isomerase [Janthinobacterium sp. PC23-8]OYO29790.1 5-deoxy-glucuronate isomerase [Janthinobacterium sp. PC23-8]